jgi:sulfite exporter TauE/SafE
MISIEITGTAFIMGLAGSLHCVGMCGPLALALPVSHSNNLSRFAGGTLYNLGRILSYAVMGLFFGSIGKYLITSHWQNRLSLALGSIILVYLFIPKKYLHFSKQTFFNKPFFLLRQQLGKLFQSKNLQSLFFIGILNGLLPCGLVYLALTSSVITGSSLNGGLFMTFFGLGTFPAMMAIIILGNYLNQQIRLKINKALPILLFLMGALLVLRGLELGVPFISPVHEVVKDGAVSCG